MQCLYLLMQLHCYLMLVISIIKYFNIDILPIKLINATSRLRTLVVVFDIGFIDYLTHINFDLLPLF